MNKKVQIYGDYYNKDRWIVVSCECCGKTFGYRNFSEDDTILCSECFAEWDGTPGPGQYEINLDVKEKQEEQKNHF